MRRTYEPGKVRCYEDNFIWVKILYVAYKILWAMESVGMDWNRIS